MKNKFSFLFIALIALTNTKVFSQITVTFKVNMSGYYVYSGGMHIAGTFATNGSPTIPIDWDPGASEGAMTYLGNNFYSINVEFPSSSIGNQLQFLFVRNDIWNDYIDYSEGNAGETFLNSSCGVDDVCCGGFNRAIFIPAISSEFICHWDHCGALTSCSPATSLNVTSLTSTSASLNWASGFGATSYQVKYKPYSAANWNIVNVNDPTISSVSISGLQSGTPYFWQVKTVCGEGSKWSRQAHFKTMDTRIQEEDEESGFISTYPNPASERLTFKGLEASASVQVMNTLGQVVWSGSISPDDFTIDVSHVASGNYLIKVQTSSSTQTISAAITR